MLKPHVGAFYFCKNTKNIQKSDFMDGFCWQGELDLTLFYKIEGYFDNQKSLMTGFMNICTHIHQRVCHKSVTHPFFFVFLYILVES